MPTDFGFVNQVKDYYLNSKHLIEDLKTHLSFEKKANVDVEITLYFNCVKSPCSVNSLMTFFCGKQFHPWILFRALFTFARLAVYFSKILMQVSHHENFEKGKFPLLKSEGKP